MAIEGRNEVLTLTPGDCLALFSPPGCDGWWIRTYQPPIITGKGELYLGGPAQLQDGLFEVRVTLPENWLDREFESPTEAVKFMKRNLKKLWRTVAE